MAKRVVLQCRDHCTLLYSTGTTKESKLFPLQFTKKMHHVECINQGISISVHYNYIEEVTKYSLLMLTTFTRHLLCLVNKQINDTGIIFHTLLW